ARTRSSAGSSARIGWRSGTAPSRGSRGAGPSTCDCLHSGAVSAPAIEISGLRKSYGDVEAVRGIDLSVAEGEIFALLGPNGAGKTTTVEILEGFRPRTAGEVRVLGMDPARRDRRLKSQIGIVLQSTGIDPYLTVAETIGLYGGY